jgi:hypothetical protein
LAVFSVHFDGPITVEHKVSIRVLSKTYQHMQRAIDRAFLIETYGDVYKHARLTSDQYPLTEFFADYPREGGIFLDATRQGAGAIIDRIASAIRPVFEQAVDRGLMQHSTLAAQFQARETYVLQMRERTQSFADVLQAPPPDWAGAYSNRSVIKEIDQLAGQITPDRVAESTVDIALMGDRTHLPFRFDAQVAKRFHEIAGYKEYGAPMIINALIRSLDRGNKYAKPSAKVQNLDTGREVTLLCSRKEDGDSLHPHHNNRPVKLYVSPFIEALGFDLMGGDLMFIAVVA